LIGIGALAPGQFVHKRVKAFRQWLPDIVTFPQSAPDFLQHLRPVGGIFAR
jgi:hypothetical protein